MRKFIYLFFYQPLLKLSALKKRKSNRLKGYDYSKNNLYFVTNCVKNNFCCFGNVIPVGTGRDLSVLHSECIQNPDLDYLVNLNEFGLIVKNQIEWLVSQYKYVDIHNYVVMPNHFHIILEIDSQKINGDEIKIKSLSSLIGAMKTTSSNQIRKLGFEDFAWHRSFYDSIIRNEKAYQNISNYIDLNPKKWHVDKFYKKG